VLLIAVFAGRGRAQIGAAAPVARPTTKSATPPPTASAVLGEWRGRSTCLITPSPCNSEVVVYEIRPDSVKRDSLAIDADKIVNGARDYMGTLTCGWNAPVLACPFRGGWWRLTLRGDTLAGFLDLADGRRFREVVVGKVHGK
jgi:hypothetical protein